jgi:non-specific serine/threonine protein kinase
LRDSKLVLETAAQAVDAKGRLDEHIADKSQLILFDNFEHVVDAADDLAGLLAACPNLELLVTSRELLRLPGEQAYVDRRRGGRPRTRCPELSAMAEDIKT